MATGNNFRNMVFLIPNDPDMFNDLMTVDSESAIECRKNQLGGLMTWMTTTIATVYIENLVKMLSLKMQATGSSDAEIDFYGLFTAVASTRHNENAEKEGNINVRFNPGERLNRDFSDEGSFEEFKNLQFVPPTKEEFEKNYFFKDLDAADKITIKEIHQKNGWTIPDQWMATRITVTYIKNLYLALINKLKTEDTRMASINLHDLIEFHIKRVQNDEGYETITFILRPGVNSKLFIKSDAMTEFSGDDD